MSGTYRTWNYRVVRHIEKFEQDGMQIEEPYYTIEECYYDENGEVDLHTEGLRIFSEDIEGLKFTLEKMLECLNKPVVDELPTPLEEE